MLGFIKYSPFEAKSEMFSLIMPVFFLIGAAAEIAWNFSFNKSQLFAFYIITEFVFLNSLHAVFTLLFFLNHDEFKSYLVSASKKIKYSLLYKWLFVYLFFVVLCCFIFFNRTLTYNEITLVSLFAVTINLCRVHHTLSQQVGISLLYYSNTPDAFQKKYLSQCVFLERSLTPLFFGYFFVSLLVPIFSNKISLNILFYINIVITLLFVLLLFLITFKLNRSFSILRLAFALRYFLYPLAFISKFAAIGIGAVHGIEYFIINKKINTTKSVPTFTKTKYIFYIALATLVFLGLISLINRFYISATPAVQNNYMGVFFVGWVLFQSLSLLHFYVDAHIFKFKDPAVQQNIGPILFKKKTST